MVYFYSCDVYRNGEKTDAIEGFVESKEQLREVKELMDFKERTKYDIISKYIDLSGKNNRGFFDIHFIAFNPMF